MALILFSLILFFLITVVFGLVVREYLLQKQDKVSLPDKYDEAKKEMYLRKYIRDKREKRFERVFALSNLFSTNFDSFTFLKSMLFLGTYALAMLITYIVIISRADPISAAYLIIFLPATFLSFPIGLIVFLTKQLSDTSNEFLLSTFTFLIYFSISSLAIFTKPKAIFTILYIIFLTLLIMNIAGCSTYVPIKMSEFN